MKIQTTYTHSIGAVRTGDIPEFDWRFFIHLLLGFLFFVGPFSSSSTFADLSGADINKMAYLHVENNLPGQGKIDILPAKIEAYEFDSNVTRFGRVSLDRVGELSKEEFERLILLSTPRKLRGRLEKYIGHALSFAEAYQVDPFWVIAIMWTESHFNNSARSYVNATGLMQIMPNTGIYLAKKLKITNNKARARKLTRVPKYNVHMGTYYIKYLLEIFNGNSKLATVAYNMGPGRVKWRLRTKRQVGVKNLYLTKVRRYYSKISKGFVNYTSNTPRPFKKTYVALNRISTEKTPNIQDHFGAISFL